MAREVCCEAGDCRCPDDLRACGDQCIAQDACCADNDCDDGRVCVDGSCACGEGLAEVEGRCAAVCAFDDPAGCDPDLCRCRGTFPLEETASVCVVNDVAPLPEDDFCDLQPCQSTAQCRDDEVCTLTVSCGAPGEVEGRCARICPGPGTSARRRGR